MKLISIVLPNALSLPGLRGAGTMTITLAEPKWAGWSVQLRGPSLFIVSPPGWTMPGQAAVGDARRAFELARSKCDLVWEMEPSDKLDQTRDWSPPQDRSDEPKKGRAA